MQQPGDLLLCCALCSDRGCADTLQTQQCAGDPAHRLTSFALACLHRVHKFIAKAYHTRPAQYLCMHA